MKLIKYLPQFLQEIREYKLLFNAEDTELQELNKKLQMILEETIVNTASTYGLTRYEKIYNIPSSSNIEERKFNILSKMNDNVPLTINWLNNKLKKLVGEGNYRINVDNDNYSINVDVSMIFENITNTLTLSLRQDLPANLIVTVNLFQTENANIYAGIIFHEGERILIKGG